MEIDSAARAQLVFYESGCWKDRFALDPTEPGIRVTGEAGKWKIEVDSSNYSAVLWMNRDGHIDSATTIVTDKYGQERQFSGMPTMEVILGQVTVY